jgi:hypothetical protein
MMKMSVFSSLAKARLNTGSIKGSGLGSGQAYDQLSTDCGYILGQYMSNKHNLLYETWTAGLRR